MQGLFPSSAQPCSEAAQPGDHSKPPFVLFRCLLAFFPGTHTCTGRSSSSPPAASSPAAPLRTAPAGCPGSSAAIKNSSVWALPSHGAGGEGALQWCCFWKSCYPTDVSMGLGASLLEPHHILVVFTRARAISSSQVQGPMYVISGFSESHTFCCRRDFFFLFFISKS